MADNLDNGSGDLTPAAHQRSAVDSGRRRFTTAGFAATGVVMTLASKPVLGCTSRTAAMSPSGWASIEVGGGGSLCPGTNVSLGMSASQWIASLGPVATDPKMNPISRTVFPNGLTPLNSSELTLLDILQSAGTGQNFAREVVVAYLNTQSGRTSLYLTLTQVAAMSTGSFTPSTGGLTWDQARITAYLKTTHTV